MPYPALSELIALRTAAMTTEGAASRIEQISPQIAGSINIKAVVHQARSVSTAADQVNDSLQKVAEAGNANDLQAARNSLNSSIQGLLKSVDGADTALSSQSATPGRANVEAAMGPVRIAAAAVTVAAIPPLQAAQDGAKLTQRPRQGLSTTMILPAPCCGPAHRRRSQKSNDCRHSRSSFAA
jgi:hypothetical protein